MKYKILENVVMATNGRNRERERVGPQFIYALLFSKILFLIPQGS